MANASEALSVASLLLTMLTGANYSLSGNLADQMSSTMSSEQNWGKASLALGFVTTLAGSIAGMIRPFTSGVMSGVKSGLKDGLKSGVESGMGKGVEKIMENLNYVQAFMNVAAGVTGIGAAIANCGLSMDKAQINSLQTQTQGYTTAGNVALQAGQSLQRAILELINNKAQAQQMTPVTR